MAARAFPWGELKRVSRGEMRAAAGVKGAVGAVPRPSEIAAALRELVASDVKVEVQGASVSGEYRGGSAVTLRTVDGAACFALEPEPALASVLLARVLDRPPPLTDPSAPLGPSAAGALAALAVETARRAGAGLVLRAAPADEMPPLGLRLTATVRLDGKAYAFVLWAAARALVSPSERTGGLESLGDLPLTLAVVASVSAGRREDVCALQIGDVWFPGAWLGPVAPAQKPGASRVERVLGRVALATPAGERGIEASSTESGGFVVRGSVIALAADEAGGATMENRDDTLREIALDAPVVVRIEVASITLSAREWGALSAGDVIGTGVKLASAVVLRVAGREVARGDLVDIDGELGVSISEIVAPGASP